MSARAGSLILVVALALGGLLYLFTTLGDDPGGAALEGERDASTAPVEDREDAELAGTPGDSLESPGEQARSVIATNEEPDPPLAVEDTAEREVDRATVAVLTGQVTDEQGRPVAGARIIAGRNVMELMAADTFGAIAMMDERFGERIQETTTDDGGFFEIVGIPPGQPGLRILATGFVPQLETSVLIAAREHQELSSPIVLEASAVVKGVVLDPSGNPIVDAKVTAEKKKSGMMGMAMLSMSDKGVKTAADGSFRLDMLELDELEVVVTHASYAPGKAEVDTREGRSVDDLEVRLERGISISGRVTGRTAGLDEDLQVVAFPGDINFMQGMQLRTAEVAEDGSFELWGMKEGSEWTVFAREDDGEDMNMMMLWTDSGLVTSRAEAVAGDRDVELAYRPAATVTFQVVDEATGRPITRLKVSDRSVMFFDDPGYQDYPEGRVRIEGQRPDEDELEIRVEVDAEGYASHIEKVDASEGLTEIDLGTLKLEPAAVAQFLTIDALTRAPIEGVEVFVAREEDPEQKQSHGQEGFSFEISYGDDAEGESDAEGLVRLETSLEGKFLVTANAEGYGPLRLDDVALAGSDVTPITLELRQGATVRVTATDINGIPLPARQIEHREGEEEGDSWWGGDESHRVTDTDGVAVFENLGEGEHGFRIAKLESTAGEPNMMMMMAMEAEEEDDDSWTTVELVETDIEELVLVELPTGNLSGRVTEAGKPLRRATLVLRRAEDEEEEEEADEDMDPAEAAFMEMSREMAGQGGPSTKTERDGSFTFEGVEIGRYVLEIDYRKRAMPAEYDVTIVAGDQVQDYDLDVAILSGKVVDGSGKGVKGALVSVVPFVEPGAVAKDASEKNAEAARGLVGEILGVEDAVRTFKTKFNGSFELRGVTPGVPLVVKVDGSAAGYQNTTSKRLELRRNESREDLQLVVELGGSLEVTVLEPDGTSTEFVLVRLERSDGSMEPMNELAMGGVKEVTGLTPGTYRVIADDEPDEDALFGEGDPSTIGKVETIVEVVGGETVTVELRLPD